MKKITLTAATMAASALVTTHAALAQPPLPPTPSPISGEITALENYIGEIYQNVGNFFIGQNYQPIKGLNKITDVNTAAVSNTSMYNPTPTPAPTDSSKPAAAPNLSPEQAALQIAAAKTNDNLSDNLMYFFYNMYNGYSADGVTVPPMNTTFSPIRGVADPEKHVEKFETFALENSATALVNAGASDSLYALPNSPVATKMLELQSESPTEASIFKPLLTPPATLNDNYFSFANLFAPLTYTPAQKAAAEEFAKYAAQSTDDLSSGVTFGAIRNNAAAMKKVLSSDTYGKYKFTVRSMLAIRSITVSSLNQLIAERTPMPGLGAAVGLPPQKLGAGNTPRVSPLQVEAYQANHRVEDSNWYKQVENASPANVQRQILIVLAEIEHQNFQAHLDSERLLAATTAETLETNLATGKGMLQVQNQKLQTEIADATRPSTPKTTGAGNETTE